MKMSPHHVLFVDEMPNQVLNHPNNKWKPVFKMYIFIISLGARKKSKPNKFEHEFVQCS